MAPINNVFNQLWSDYVQMNPQAQKIHQLLEARGETIQNDHVAFRSFSYPGYGIDRLAKVFEAAGYEAKGEYHFEQKKLYAKHWEPPVAEGLPKVFISELLIDQLSSNSQAIISRLIGSARPDFFENDGFYCAGRPWEVSYQDYLSLSEESEYAAWMAAFGYRANHFTVLVNALKTFQGLEALNTYLKSEGFLLNSSGSEIKGSPREYLEQSSTMAPEVEVKFEDGVHRIPSCYYEFARRYPVSSGELYQGFVAASADKIFESTHRSSKK